MLFSGSEFIPRILQEFFEKALRDFELARHDKLYSLWSWGIIWWRVAVYWHIVSNYRHSVITHTQLRYVSVFACLQTNMYIDEKSFKKKHIYWKYRVVIEKISKKVYDDRRGKWVWWTGWAPESPRVHHKDHEASDCDCATPGHVYHYLHSGSTYTLHLNYCF